MQECRACMQVRQHLEAYVNEGGLNVGNEFVLIQDLQWQTFKSTLSRSMYSRSTSDSTRFLICCSDVQNFRMSECTSVTSSLNTIVFLDFITRTIVASTACSRFSFTTSTEYNHAHQPVQLICYESINELAISCAPSLHNALSNVTSFELLNCKIRNGRELLRLIREFGIEAEMFFVYERPTLLLLFALQFRRDQNTFHYLYNHP